MTNPIEINIENFNAKEYTIKQLSDDPNFPWKERKIRQFIADGELLYLEEKGAGGQGRLKIIPEFELKRFLKKKISEKQSKIDLFLNKNNDGHTTPLV